MAIGTVTLKDVIAKLDKLDGVEDGYYTNIPLHVENSTGICEIADEVKDQLSGSGINVPTGAGLYVADGKKIAVNCKLLVEKPKTLTDIANKLPTFKFMADIGQKKKISMFKWPGCDDQMGYHIVDHMIVSLLVGVSKTDESYSALFSYIPFMNYSKTINQMFTELSKAVPQVAPCNVDIKDSNAGYKFFGELGKKYGFDTKPFKPTKN